MGNFSYFSACVSSVFICPIANGNVKNGQFNAAAKRQKDARLPQTG